MPSEGMAKTVVKVEVARVIHKAQVEVMTTVELQLESWKGQ